MNTTPSAPPTAVRLLPTAADLAGRRALVTGADAGLGAGVASALAAAGARVAIGAGGAVEALVERIRGAGNEAFGRTTDLGEEAAVEALFEQVTSTFGGIDLLVAVGMPGPDRPLRDCPLTDWDVQVRANLTGPFLCARAAIRRFLAQPPAGGGTAGRIVFVCAGQGLGRGQAGDAALRGGLCGLMRGMAREVAPFRIRVNGIAPGAIRSEADGADWDRPDTAAALLERIPFGRIGSVQDIGRAAVWLASDAADYVTGATLVVDGGMALLTGAPEVG